MGSHRPANDGLCALAHTASEPDKLRTMLQSCYGSSRRIRRGDNVAANINPLAGKPADPSMLANIPRLVTAYFAGKPDPTVAAQRVAFGTSGHRGSAFNNAFNEAHILAISQALCDHRASARHLRPAVRRHRHPRAGGTGAGERARGVRGQRRRGDDRRAGRLHADAGDLARDPDLQQGPQRAASPMAS